MNSKEITTITFFKFTGFEAYWGFVQMQRAILKLKKVPGLRFFKYMGSGGKNGFSKTINFNVYTLLCVWESEIAAEEYFRESPQFSKFLQNSDEYWTIYMKAVKARGLWSGVNPFDNVLPYEGGPIAVITRARIKWKYLFNFWKYVRPVSADLDKQEGLIFAIGIGEYPWFMQATFSVWENYEAVKAYAYQTPLHAEVVKKTHQLGWYAEEMFANFVPYRRTGSWSGVEMDLFLE
jgi:hypothetical protein